MKLSLVFPSSQLRNNTETLPWTSHRSVFPASWTTRLVGFATADVRPGRSLHQSIRAADGLLTSQVVVKTGKPAALHAAG